MQSSQQVVSGRERKKKIDKQTDRQTDKDRNTQRSKGGDRVRQWGREDERSVGLFVHSFELVDWLLIEFGETE